MILTLEAVWIRGCALFEYAVALLPYLPTVISFIRIPFIYVRGKLLKTD